MQAETQSRIFGFILLAIALMLVLFTLKKYALIGTYLLNMYLLIMLMVFVACNFLSGAWKFIFEE